MMCVQFVHVNLCVVAENVKDKASDLCTLIVTCASPILLRSVSLKPYSKELLFSVSKSVLDYERDN